jgi:crotonobetainyl-CoA:carnitine CoA-transferase CaiB-like acyl-CoA transferase
MRFGTADVGPRGPAPSLGEHSREILERCGVGVEEVERLVADGVVGVGQGGHS